MPIKNGIKILAHEGSFVQVYVKSQRDADGGGAESCGYHVLKNSFSLAHSFIAEEENKKSYVGRLYDPALIEKLYGQSGCWRKTVVEKRKSKIIADFLYDLLLKSLSVDKVISKNKPYGSMVYCCNLSKEWISFTRQDLTVKSIISSLRMIANNITSSLDIGNHFFIEGKKLYQELRNYLAVENEALEPYFMPLHYRKVCSRNHDEH